MPGEVSVSVTPESADDLPVPLVPAEVDLRNFTWLPLDATFVNRAAFLLASGDELKAHIALLCRAWSEVPAASLPSDDRLLAALSCAGTRWQKVKAAALTGFVLCTDDRYYHVSLSTKAIEAWGRSKAGSENARKRWHRAASAPADATGNAPASTVAYATASTTAMLGEERRVEEKNLRSVGTANAVPARAKHPKHEEDKPTLEEVRRYCHNRRNKVDPERWFSYYESNGWKIGKNAMRNWQAAVRTWERNEVGNTGQAVAVKERACSRCGAVGGSMVEGGSGRLCLPCYRQ